MTVVSDIYVTAVVKSDGMATTTGANEQAWCEVGGASAISIGVWSL